jgi:hypothetical protein
VQQGIATASVLSTEDQKPSNVLDDKTAQDVQLDGKLAGRAPG